MAIYAEKARVIERGQFDDGFTLKSRKTTAKKCTKKCAASAKLLSSSSLLLLLLFSAH